MESKLIAEVAEISVALGVPSNGSTFSAAVHRLHQLLVSVPDFPAGAFSEAGLATLGRLSDDAIDQIERRVESAADSPADQQRLVEGVYAIRRALEEIDHWRRHYLPNNETS